MLKFNNDFFNRPWYLIKRSEGLPIVMHYLAGFLVYDCNAGIMNKYFDFDGLINRFSEAVSDPVISVDVYGVINNGTVIVTDVFLGDVWLSISQIEEFVVCMGEGFKVVEYDIMEPAMLLAMSMLWDKAEGIVGYNEVRPCEEVTFADGSRLLGKLYE